ncbi:hypothetical protein MnTg02_00086 [bacterium MnTg02]|nr:hypothetical protein MnTg02_00086 [bacterium MnTg02]
MLDARRYVLEAVDLDLTSIGGQGLPHLVAAMFGMDAQILWMPMALIIAGLLLAWCFSGCGLKGNPRDVTSGIVIGLVVAGGFAATGIIGNDPFEPTNVRSLSYVIPPGRAVIYLLTFIGATIDFSIALVFGTLAGSLAAAMWNKELRIEAYDDAREMRRHLLGAFLMGFGGVSAYGCTIRPRRIRHGDPFCRCAASARFHPHWRDGRPVLSPDRQSVRSFRPYLPPYSTTDLVGVIRLAA